MADTDSKPESAITKTDPETLGSISGNREAVRKIGAGKRHRIPKTLRRMKVSYASTRHYDRQTNRTTHYTRSASLRLHGHWMEEAGFTIDTELDVRVMPGCLVITTRPTETPLMRVMKSSASLPKEDQQQVMAFLKGVMAKVMLEKV